MRWTVAVWQVLAARGRSIRSHGFELRVVRRVGLECPHGRGVVEVDLLTDHAGKPEAVLRCSAHASCPPTCDQACRRCAEAVLDPAHAVIVYPAGSPFEEID